MREKRSTREGRRTGLRIRNIVKRLEDGTEDFNEYFESTDEEEDNTTNLETESEMQDTRRSYNINFTGVSVDSSDTNEYPLIHHRPQGNSSKYVKDLGKKSMGRKSYGAKKKSFSKKRQSAPFQYSDSDSDSSYQEKTYVDKSVVTTPVSFTFSNRVTPGIGFSHSVAESPNLKSKAVKASSSRSIMVEPQRNISSTTIGRRDRESGILKSGNSFNLSDRSNKERKSSLRNSYEKSGDQATPKRLSSGLEIQKSAELDDGIGMDETFSSKALRSSKSDCSRLQPKKSVSFSQNLNEDISDEDDGIEMPPVSDVNPESKSKKELSLCRSPRLKRSLPASDSRTDLINRIEAQAASVKRKLNFSTLNKELNTTRGQELTSPKMLSLSKRFSPQQSCVDMDETAIIGRSPNVNLSRRRLSASMTVPVDRVGEEFDKERDSNAFKTPSVAVNINPLPSTSQSRRKHCSSQSKNSPLQNRSSLQHAYNSHSATISREELDKTQIDKSTISANSKSPRPHKNTSDLRHNYRQTDEKSLHLKSPKLSDSRNYQDGKYLERETRIERDHNKSNSSMRRDPIEPRHSASFRHGELWDSGVPELPADNAFEILKAQTQPGRSISRSQFNHLLKSSERDCKQSDSESSIPESQSDCDGEIGNVANRKPLRESQNLKDRILKSTSNARDEPSNIDNYRSNSSFRKETKKSCGQFRQSASFRPEEPEEAGVSEKLTNNACNYELLPSQKQQVRSSGSRYQYHHVQKSPQRVQEESDFESDISELPVERGNIAAQKYSGVPELPADNAFEILKAQTQPGRSISRYQFNHLLKSSERDCKQSDSESAIPESQSDCDGKVDNLANRKPLRESQNLKDKILKSASNPRDESSKIDNFRSNSSFRKETKKYCGQFRQSASFRPEEPEEAGVSEKLTNNACNYELLPSQKRKVRSSGSRYQYHHVQKSPQRVQEESDLESDISELPVERGNLAAQKHFAESRNYEERHLKYNLSEKEDRAERDHVRSPLSMREPNEFFDQCSPSHRYRNSSSFRVEEQEDYGVPEMQMNKESDYRRLQGQQQQVRSSESRYQSNDPERVHEESDSENDMPRSQLHSVVERDSLAGKKSLSESRNYEERHLKSNLSEKEDRAERDHVRSPLSMREPNEFFDQCSPSHRYRNSSSFRVEEQGDYGVPKMQMNKESDYRRSQGQQQQVRSSESRYRSNDPERVHEESDSENDMPQSQLHSVVERDSLAGKKSLSVCRNHEDEDSRNRKSISSTRETQTNRCLRSSVRKEPKDSCSNSHQYRHSASIRLEEPDNASVPETPTNMTSNFKIQKNQTQQKRSSESRYRFDHRQQSEERFHKEGDSEIDALESHLRTAKSVHLPGLMLTKSRSDEGDRYRKSISSESKAQTDGNDDHGCNSPHNKSYASFRQEEQRGSSVPKALINKASNYGRSKDQKQLERSSKSSYQFDHRQTSQRYSDRSDSDREMSESQLDKAQEKVNLSGQKYLSNSTRQHESFSSARNEENPNDRRKAVSRKIPCPNLNTSKSKRELNRSRRGIPQGTVNDCDISLLSRSISGRTINSPGQKDSRHSECKRVVSPLKRGEEQGSDISICDLQNRKTNTSLELNCSKSGQTPILLQTSRKKSISRSHKPKSPSKLVSENLIHNDIVEDDRNPEISEESRPQMLGSVKRKRNSSPWKEQGQEELENQEIVNDEHENNISPRRQIETSPQETNSRVHCGTSRTKESNHLPKPKTKKRVERNNKLKSRDKTPSPTPYRRGRPQRTRIRPLAYWKGEYRTFRYTKAGDIVLAEVNLIDSPSIRIPKKVHEPVVKKQKIEDDVIPDQEQLFLYDEATGKNIKLVGVLPELDWSAGSLGSDPGYRVARSEWAENFTSGFLDLNINSTKEEQYSPKLSLKFVVMEGIVRFTLRDRDGGEMAVNVGRRNYMIVPRRIPYSLTNCYSGKSLLYFHSVMNF